MRFNAETRRVWGQFPTGATVRPEALVNAGAFARTNFAELFL